MGNTIGGVSAYSAVQAAGYDTKAKKAEETTKAEEVVANTPKTSEEEGKTTTKTEGITLEISNRGQEMANEVKKMSKEL